MLFYQIPSFLREGFLKHGFTTRVGGKSPGVYASLNLSRTREHSVANKETNYKRVCNALSIGYETLTLVNYAHGDGVHVAGKADAGKGITREIDYDYCDAMVTDTDGVSIVTLHADCVPIFMADRKKRVVAAGHAGWKGTYRQIVVKMLRRMNECFGSAYEDILVGIGPHIRSCCFEVKRDVADPFTGRFGDGVVEERGGKLFVNLQDVLLGDLARAGVPAENVTCADLCTHCEEDLFYSHRRDNGQTGAMGAFIAL